MDIYAEVTDRILATLEQGELPWTKPWVGSSLCVGHRTGRPYSILNQLLLGEPGEYITFLQAQQEGGKIRSGAKGRLVVFWKMQEIDEDGIDLETGEIRKRPVLRHYHVFHIRDTEGIEPKHEPFRPLTTHAERNSMAEEIAFDYMNRSGVDLVNAEGNLSAYNPEEDLVILPLMKQFPTTAGYYATLMHELAHSTGTPQRLNRFHGTERFGSCDYSKEELVAELSSAMVLHTIGMETDFTFRNQAAYLQGWLKALQNDKRMIVYAAGKAEAAARLILNVQEQETEMRGGKAQ